MLKKVQGPRPAMEPPLPNAKTEHFLSHLVLGHRIIPYFRIQDCLGVLLLILVAFSVSTSSLGRYRHLHLHRAGSFRGRRGFLHKKMNQPERTAAMGQAA